MLQIFSVILGFACLSLVPDAIGHVAPPSDLAEKGPTAVKGPLLYMDRA